MTCLLYSKKEAVNYVLASNSALKKTALITLFYPIMIDG